MDVMMTPVKGLVDLEFILKVMLFSNVRLIKYKDGRRYLHDPTAKMLKDAFFNNL